MVHSLKRTAVRGIVGLSKAAGRNVHRASVGGVKVEIEYVDPSTFNKSRRFVRDGQTSEGIPLPYLTGDYDGIVDVGAHIGIYSVVLGALNPGSDLYLFEPAERPRELLAKNLHRNGFEQRAHISDAVVTGYAGETVRFADQMDVGSPSSQIVEVSDSTAVKRTTTSLSETFAGNGLSHPFVKLDAEGAEESIISDLVSQDVTDKLEGIVEIHPDKLENSTQEDLLAEFDRHDFVYEHLVESSPNPDLPRPIYWFSST